MLKHLRANWRHVSKTCKNRKIKTKTTKSKLMDWILNCLSLILLSVRKSKSSWRTSKSIIKRKRNSWMSWMAEARWYATSNTTLKAKLLFWRNIFQPFKPNYHLYKLRLLYILHLLPLNYNLLNSTLCLFLKFKIKIILIKTFIR